MHSNACQLDSAATGVVWLLDGVMLVTELCVCCLPEGLPRHVYMWLQESKKANRGLDSELL